MPCPWWWIWPRKLNFFSFLRYPPIRIFMKWDLKKDFVQTLKSPCTTSPLYCAQNDWTMAHHGHGLENPYSLVVAWFFGEYLWQIFWQFVWPFFWQIFCQIFWWISWRSFWQIVWCFFDKFSDKFLTNFLTYVWSFNKCKL